MAKLYKAPNCISEDGKHSLVESKDEPFWAECELCAERFCLVAETVIKKSGIDSAHERLPANNPSIPCDHILSIGGDGFAECVECGVRFGVLDK